LVQKVWVMVYFILLLSLYFTVVIHAQEVQVFIVGAGQASCGKWIESKNIPQRHYQIKQWVLGFISGNNWSWAGTNKIQVKSPDEDAVVAFIDRYCKNNPLQSILYGAMSLIHEFGLNVSTQYKRD